MVKNCYICKPEQGIVPDVPFHDAEKMLTPKQSGSISPEEIGNESHARVPSTTGNGSAASNTCQNDSLPEEFLASRRVGRRNALTYTESGMVDLPNRFEELSMETDESSTEGRNSSKPSTSKQQH